MSTSTQHWGMKFGGPIASEIFEYFRSVIEFSLTDLEYLSYVGQIRDSFDQPLVDLSYPVNALKDALNHEYDELMLLRQLRANEMNSELDEEICGRLTNMWGRLHEWILNDMRVLDGVVSQRMEGLAIEDHAYPVHSRFEFFGSQKVFSALDNLVYDYARTLLGDIWLRVQHWKPVGFLGEGMNYSIHPQAKIIRAPKCDIYRLRFWPWLSHEMGHVVYDEYLTPSQFSRYVEKLELFYEGNLSSKKFREIKLREVEKRDRLSNINDFLENELARLFLEIARGRKRKVPDDRILDVQNAVYYHSVELISDGLGIFAAGPSLALAAASSMNDYFLGTDSYANLVNRPHPPDIVRVWLWAYMLDRLGFNEDVLISLQSIFPSKHLKERHKFVNWISELGKSKPIVHEAFLCEYENVVEKLADMLIELIQDRIFSTMSANDWSEAQLRFENGKLQDAHLRPSVVLNVAWIKRLSVFRRLVASSSQNTDQNTFDESFTVTARSEKQIFDELISMLMQHNDELVESR